MINPSNFSLISIYLNEILVNWCTHLSGKGQSQEIACYLSFLSKKMPLINYSTNIRIL